MWISMLQMHISCVFSSLVFFPVATSSGNCCLGHCIRKDFCTSFQKSHELPFHCLHFDQLVKMAEKGAGKNTREKKDSLRAAMYRGSPFTMSCFVNPSPLLPMLATSILISLVCSLWPACIYITGCDRGRKKREKVGRAVIGWKNKRKQETPEKRGGGEQRLEERAEVKRESRDLKAEIKGGGELFANF